MVLLAASVGPFSTLLWRRALKHHAVCARLMSTASLDVNVIPPDQNGTTILELNRVKAKNAFSKSMIATMEAALESLHEDTDSRVVIVRSRVPGVFCAGADLKERLSMQESEVGPFVARLRALMVKLERLPMPTIAALDGLAVGGGLEMALACDLRIMAHNVKLGLVETKLAIIPGAGGTQRLPRLVGTSKAKELIYTGRLVDAGEAYECGLVNEFVEQNASHDGAFIRAKEIAAIIGKNGPIAVRMAKRSIDEGTGLSIEKSMEVEEACYSRVIPTKDRVEGLSAFQEKRTPEFKGL